VRYDHYRVSLGVNGLTTNAGRDGSVGTATSHGPHDPGIESSGGEIFHTPTERPWGPPRLLYNVYWVSFTGGKAPGGRGIGHPPRSIAEVQ